jgi:solute carrier family 25 carnitine/acylcarnitine transporter 20/29
MNEATIDFVSGWIGGIAGVIGCHPFDTVKCRIQSQGSGDIPVRYRSGWHCFSDTVKTEGIRGLYKGVLPPVLTQGVINAIVFGVEGPTSRFLHPRIDDGPMKEIKIGFLAGMAGGFAQSFVCAPMELVKTRTQHQSVGEATRYRGNWATLKNIYKTRGFTGCFQGWGVTAFRDTPAFGIYFAMYHGLMHYIAKRKGISRDELSCMLLYPFLCGGATGMTTWIVNYPVDLVKTRIQLDGADGKAREYRSSWDCFMKAWREGGVRLLYRGLVPCCVRAFANNSFLFVTVEISKRAFHRFSDT